MLKVFKKVKGMFTRKPQEEEEQSQSKSPTVPGTDESKTDIGKKVFERTGRLREGVGQSSTVAPENENSRAKLSREESARIHYKKRKNVVNTNSGNFRERKKSSTKD